MASGPVRCYVVSMSRTLTLPDEAVEIADSLARKQSISREEAVLRALKGRQDELADAERVNQEGWDEVFRAAREIARNTPPELRTHDHDDLYDENGLPV